MSTTTIRNADVLILTKAKYETVKAKIFHLGNKPTGAADAIVDQFGHYLGSYGLVCDGPNTVSGVQGELDSKYGVSTVYGEPAEPDVAARRHVIVVDGEKAKVVRYNETLKALELVDSKWADSQVPNPSTTKKNFGLGTVILAGVGGAVAGYLVHGS